MIKKKGKYLFLIWKQNKNLKYQLKMNNGKFCQKIEKIKNAFRLVIL